MNDQDEYSRRDSNSTLDGNSNSTKCLLNKSLLKLKLRIYVKLEICRRAAGIPRQKYDIMRGQLM